MTCVQGDHEVQTLAPHRPDYPFTYRIRNWRSHRCFEHSQPHIPDTLVNLFGENRIPVMDQEAVGVIGRNGLSELLQRPLSCGMSGDIDVEESAAFMFNHHEHIEYVEGGGDRHAEVASQYPF